MMMVTIWILRLFRNNKIAFLDIPRYSMIAFFLLQLCVALHTNAAQGHVSATGSAAWKTILLFDLNERKGMWLSVLNDI